MSLEKLPPGIDVAEADVNSVIRLADRPEMANSYRNDDTLDLHLTNLGNVDVIFPDNFDVRVLKIDGGQWTAVANNSYGGGPFLLPAPEAYPLGLIVSILPSIPNLTSPTTIRVVVVGRLGNAKGKKVAAFADVTIFPAFGQGL